MLQAELRVASGKQQGSLIPLPQGKFLVGREEDCHLRPNSELVSRHHCVFTVDEYSVRLRDLGSTNGTLVNGERLRGAVTLKPGDRIVIGKLDFELRVQGGDTETSMQVSEITSAGFPMPATAPVAVPDLEPEHPSSETMTELSIAAIQQAAAMEAVAAYQQQQHLQQPMQMPGYGMPMGYPQQGYQQPGYPQPGYPPQQYGYPGYPPQMPGYYQPPMQQMPMGYPMPQAGYGMPMQQMPPQQAPPPESTDSASTSGSDIEVKLPNPEDTGAKASESGPGGGGGKKLIPDTAEKIIKQYMNRR